MQKPSDGPTHVLHIQQECIVPPDSAELVVRHLPVPSELERVCQFSLLFDGKEDIALDAEYECWDVSEPLQSRS